MTEDQGLGLGEVIELHHRMLASPRDTKVDATYLFALTSDNERSVFESAGDILKRGLSSKILIIDGEKRNGFPGIDEWRKRIAQHIPGNEVTPVPIRDRGNVNTRSESDALMEYAKNEGLDSLYVASIPFHLPRAFMTAVSAAIDREANTRVLPYYGPELDWDEFSMHSQGTEGGTRRELVRTELERIRRYLDGTQGAVRLQPIREVLKYIRENS